MITVERLRNRRAVRLAGIGLVLASFGLTEASCSIDSFTVKEVTTIHTCSGEQTPIEATFQGSPHYQRKTDPTILAKQQEHEANAGHAYGAEAPNGDILAGVGEVVCRSESNPTTYFVTTIGAQIMNLIKGS